MTVQEWNAGKYAREGRFVADLAGSLVDTLAPQPGERILDVGCGDGALTLRLAARGASVVGVDSSAAMVAAAREAGVDAHVVSAEALDFDRAFDGVFSNAALHWVRNQEAAVAGIFRALKPGGRFVAEMGGQGNIAAVRVALRAALQHVGAGHLLADEGLENTFATAEEFRARLEGQGFVVDSIELYARPTRLPASGIRGWYETFRTGALQSLSDAQRAAVLDEAEALLSPVLRDSDGTWIADYVRLRWTAHRPA